MEESKMKCQECGKNEVNYHYSSNVNGCVTESWLCSDCAAKSGYDLSQLVDFSNIIDLGKMFEMGQSFDFRSIFSGNNPPGMLPEGMFQVRRGGDGFTPMTIPFLRTNTLSPFALLPFMGMGASLLGSSPSVARPLHASNIPCAGNTPGASNMPGANTVRKQDGVCGCGCGKSASEEKKAEVSEEMSRKRELNMQMRAAIEKEDFEKAAQLRDLIRELGD